MVTCTGFSQKSVQNNSKFCRPLKQFDATVKPYHSQKHSNNGTKVVGILLFPDLALLQRTIIRLLLLLYIRKPSLEVAATNIAIL